MVDLSSLDPGKLATSDTLALLADVEKSLAKLRERAGDDVERAEEAARLAREMKSLEDAVTRLVAVADRSAALMREVDERRTRADRSDRTNRIIIAVLILVLVVALIR